MKNWRTGAEVARYAVPDVVWLDVRADGALVTADRDGNVVERLPGAAPRVLSRRGAGPAFAGQRVVFIRRIRPGVVQLQVADPDGRVRALGVPSADLKEFTTDAQRVLWRAALLPSTSARSRSTPTAAAASSPSTTSSTRAERG